MISYLIWIPSLFVVCLLSALVSVYVNKNPNSYLFYLLFLPIPVWAFITKISKNLIFDGILYDVLMCVFFVVGFLLCGEGSSFKLVNYMGILVTFIGIILLKI